MQMTDDADDEEEIRRIEELLLGSDRAHRDRGLEMLDERFRKRFFGTLRLWSDGNGNRQNSLDVGVVWQGVLEAVVKFVESGNFESRGKLDGLLLRFAGWRACDCIRKRKKREDDTVDVSAEATRRADEAHGLQELLWSISHHLRRLAEDEHLVIEIYLKLKGVGLNEVLKENVEDTDDGTTKKTETTAETVDKSTLYADLTKAFNRQSDEKRTETAVQSLLKRAIEKLRADLIREGYWDDR